MSLWFWSVSTSIMPLSIKVSCPKCSMHCLTMGCMAHRQSFLVHRVRCYEKIAVLCWVCHSSPLYITLSTFCPKHRERKIESASLADSTLTILISVLLVARTVRHWLLTWLESGLTTPHRMVHFMHLFSPWQNTSKLALPIWLNENVHLRSAQ